MNKEISKCRICGSRLQTLFSLGEQALTGIFPRSKSEIIPKGPLELVKCDTVHNPEACGLVQLKHSFDLKYIYGPGYGYRSSLNSTITQHLSWILYKITKFVSLEPKDIIVDIGSNDGSLLRCLPKKGYHIIGMDPTAEQFKGYYRDDVHVIPEFFSKNALKEAFNNNKKAKLITSIAMFYDLENPLEFMQDIFELLEENGIWAFEQSYLPAMLKHNAYDTICHEHLEYYSLKQIKWMADRVGFKILDVTLTDSNAGSFLVIVKKRPVMNTEGHSENFHQLLEKENQVELDNINTYNDFYIRVNENRNQLTKLINSLKSRKKRVLGYGASTKGNVILQLCGFTRNEINSIADINKDKFSSFTPGSLIPIIDENKAREMKPDYFLVLPWHFKNFILNKEKDFLQKAGTKLIFPLPEIKIV